MCICTNSGQIQMLTKCAQHLLQISNIKIHLNLRFEVPTTVNMKGMVLQHTMWLTSVKVTVFQHRMQLTSEECAAYIFMVTSKMKMEAARSCKLLVCIMPKYINEDPNLHWNVISKCVQTVPTLHAVNVHTAPTKCDQ